ncbi:META domain-containing protein [uncultured Psychrobacter sp.]|uniref:META domain-containing protein n=1 Tax=uncultured Psychrobacter sp. TaxID=259303 RepID=UPI002604C73C|nr:META domain-containing protein [uncultured Psychrobacter sp.]
MTHLIKKLQVTVLTILFSVTALLGCQTLNKAPAPTITKAPKGTEPITDLPITYELLGRYRWRLVSATDSDNQIITELSRPGFPVVANFGYRFNDEYHVGFSSDCNGVGGPYTLTPDHILLIGSGPQTMMGCGPKREAAEDKIRALEQSSRSQLTLTQLANSNIDNPSLPYYLLIQKMATGETLIWKNSALIDK